MSIQKRRTIAKEFEENKTVFSLVFIGVFIALFVLLAMTDMLPNAPGFKKPTVSDVPIVPKNEVIKAIATSTVTTPPVAVVSEVPVSISIDSISLSAKVSNPNDTNIETLDTALLSGAVRYPTSARLGVNGTVLLFGHSSYLPVIHNQAYKAFDGIQNLLKGDTISVFSATKEYRYKVVGVRTANVHDADANTIPLPSNAQHLVLVTCDSFASKTDRFVVTADLAGEYELVR